MVINPPESNAPNKHCSATGALSYFKQVRQRRNTPQPASANTKPAVPVSEHQSTTPIPDYHNYTCIGHPNISLGIREGIANVDENGAQRNCIRMKFISYRGNNENEMELVDFDNRRVIAVVMTDDRGEQYVKTFVTPGKFCNEFERDFKAREAEHKALKKTESIAAWMDWANAWRPAPAL